MSKTLKIGVVGFSRNQFNKKAARKILKDAFEALQQKHPDKNIEIVSGYTNSGVPKIAYELAQTFQYTTVGFSAKQALRVKSGVFPVDKTIIIGEKFGDESNDFVRHIDGLIRVGGGKQSRHEVALFKQVNLGRPIHLLLKEFEVDWYGD